MIYMYVIILHVLHCNTCKMSYIRQTSTDLNQRYQEHIGYIRNNDPHSAYAQHILQNLNEYGSIANTMSQLKPIHKTSMFYPLRTTIHSNISSQWKSYHGTRHRWTNPTISFGHRYHAYVSKHMKTKTDQHPTHNTPKSATTFLR
jgi:hypothetical protein